MAEVEKLKLTSLNIAEDKKRLMRQFFPEVFTENKVDFEKLKAVLGEDIETGKERYGLHWAGKSNCIKIIQQPSIGTLKPCREESVNFDETENLFIEGDNLEVLKLLQSSYYGKIKMIYIDPPYNTGNDFIYPDDYSESLETYLKYTGQLDENGKKFSTNPETDGRFHTKWINMMYPRLYLARNLLREDGVIFVSIDDNEVANLRKIMDEIFGEENFVVELVWKKKYTGGKHTKSYVDLHEYILVYAKNVFELGVIEIDRPDEEKGKFIEEDEFIEERGRFYVRPLKSNLAPRPTLVYPIKAPDGSILKTQWIVSKDTFEKLLSQKRVEFRKKRDGSYQIYRKYYEKDGEGNVKPPSLIERFPNTEAKFELKEIFKVDEGRDNVFYTVKPTSLIRYLFEPYTKNNNADIILDFFAGSGTTAQAVIELNKEDEGNRKFILVQLPEPTDNQQYKTITEIGKERIRRVIKKIKEENESSLNFKDKKQDLGFKVLKLDKSNFKVWDGWKAKTEEEIERQLELHIDHIDHKSSQEDILYEILLKSGFDLTTKIEKIRLAEKDVFSVDDGLLFICLEEDITKEVLKEMAEREPVRVTCLDEGFKGNDQLKTNAVQIMKIRNIEFMTV